MDDSEAGPPVIGLPERLDRKMRLGPFPSSRDALKFVTYAAAGALLAPFASPWVWLPVVCLGFAVSIWRPDGQAVDERALAFTLWKIRAWDRRNSMKNESSRTIVRQALLQLSPHRYVAILRTGGTPVAYLPPDELSRRFELFRELLRSSEGSISFLATTVPIRSLSVRPPTPPEDEREVPALSGYSELVALLCRRRLLRRVYIVLGASAGSTEEIGRLEGRVASMLERLTGLGLRPIRLKDRGLTEAARRFGWPAEVTHG